VFGVPIEAQLKIEHYLDNLIQLQPLSGPVLALNYPDEFFDYYDRYSAFESRFSKDLCYPCFSWPKIKNWKPDF